MNNKKRFPFGALFFVVATIAVLTTYYFRNLDIIKQEPSGKWGSSIVISSGNISETIDVLDMDNYVIVVHRDGDNLKLIKTDTSGAVLKENNISMHRDVKNIQLGKSEGKVYLTMSVYKDRQRNPVINEIDENLNLINENKFDGYERISKINDSLVLLYKDTAFEVYELGKGKIIEEEVGVSRYYTANVFNDEIHVIRYDNTKKQFLDSVYVDNKASKEITLFEKHIGDSETLLNPMVFVDDKYINICYEQLMKGSSNGVKINAYDKSTGEIIKNDLYYPGSRISEYGRRSDVLTGYVKHVEDGREIFYDELEYKIVGGKVTEPHKFSNTAKKTLFTSVNGNYGVFADYKGYNDLEVRLTSSNGSIVADKSIEKKEQFSYAFGITMKGFANSLVNMFTVGYSWVLPALIAMGILFWFDSKMEKKIKIAAFSLVTVACLWLQISRLKSWIYDSMYRIPEYLSFGVCIAIIVVTLAVIVLSTFKKYVNGEETIPFAGFLGLVVLQAIFILNIYVPYAIRI